MGLRLALLLVCAMGAAASPAASGAAAPKRSKAKKSASSKPLTVDAIAVSSPGLDLAAFTYEDTAPLAPDAVEVVVHACCLTASDVQQCRGDNGPCLLPLVPGREAVGVVSKVGASVKGLSTGDRVAVLLGTGMDSEADDDGADRSALDALTTGAAARRLRVPARWAFELPNDLPSLQAAGLLHVGGAVWAQLTQRRLPKGAKLGVVGSGAAAALAVQLAEAIGLEAYSVGSGGQTEEGLASTAEYVDAEDAEHLRLHTGSFDAVIVTTAAPTAELAPYIPLLVRGGAVLLAATSSPLLTLPPRAVQEKRISVHGPPALSRKATLQMLAFCADRACSWPAAEGELTAADAAAALAALDGAPDGRSVLIQPEELAKWKRIAKKRKAAAKAGGGGGGASSLMGGTAADVGSSVFGVFGKLAGETRRMASAVTDSISEQTQRLVEQVEKEEMQEKEMREGALQLGPVGTAAAASASDEEDEDEDADDEEDDEDDDGDDEDEDEEDEDEDEDEDDEDEEDDDDDEDDEDEDDDDDDDEDEDDEDDEEEDDEDDDDDDDDDDDED